ncbi:MAG: formyltetrahydrofolate deformylase [Candidatus Omnitrophota bacterium]|jgi:formyltetrahydrofolate deformylase
MLATAILLISTEDKKGITAAVTNFVSEHGGNILHADQHIDEHSNTFFMRVEWCLDGFGVVEERIEDEFAPIAKKFNIQYELYFSGQKQKMAIFVSKPQHCLYNLLYRYRSGQLNCEIAAIISNHSDARQVADEYDIPYHLFEINPANKQVQEKKEIELLKSLDVDLIVLARYHQIMTQEFIDEFPSKIINIHHSFLPAFAGQAPYLQAYEKGVKLIGATSHYIIEALDEGPIIEQETARVSHRDSVSDLKLKGEDLERGVLARAVQWHLDRKILTYGNKTVVFD